MNATESSFDKAERTNGRTTGQMQRDSNLELYRIVCMLLIIASHYVSNSGLLASDGPIAAAPLAGRSLFLLLFGAWGKTGINCFVLITGYFMCTSRITARKFMKLICEVMLYRILISAVFWISGYQPFSLMDLVFTLIPVRSIGNGFTNAFLVFYLFIPFLNLLVRSMTEKQQLLLILLCGFLYVFLGTVPKFSVTMNYVSWFCVLYFIASYFRQYPKRSFENRTLWGILTLISLLLSAASVAVGAWFGARSGKSWYYSFVTDSNTLLALTNGVTSFMLFRNLKIRQSKWINTISASTFGAFLIHTRGDTMRQWLWQDMIDCVGHYEMPLMPLYAIGCVLTIFCVCVLIDQIRIRFLETPAFRLWDANWSRISERWNGLEKKLTERLKISS